MKSLRLETPETEFVLNIPVKEDHSLSVEAPPGSYVLFNAEINLVIPFSVCLRDILPISGMGHLPIEAHFLVHYMKITVVAICGAFL
jgi:uncharacterized protein